MMKAGRRLWWTADKSRLVEDGDPEAATLAYADGDQVRKEHEALVPGKSDADAELKREGEQPEAEAKAAEREGDKARAREGDKGGKR